MNEENYTIQFDSAQEMWETVCPKCGAELGVRLLHQHGLPKETVAVCMECDQFVLPISTSLYQDFIDLCSRLEEPA